jgi:hypothetical protein
MLYFSVSLAIPDPPISFPELALQKDTRSQTARPTPARKSRSPAREPAVKARLPDRHPVPTASRRDDARHRSTRHPGRPISGVNTPK